MKPRELYSGQAPAAIGMMGQGLAEVGANIARTTQQGYQSLGEGIGKGIQAVAGAYDQYKQAKTANSMTKLMLDDPEYRGMLGIRSDEDADAIKKNHDLMIKQYGQIGGAQFANKFLEPLRQYHALGREFEFKKNIAIALSSPEAALKMAQTDLAKAQADALRRKGVPTSEAPAFGGSNIFDQTMPGQDGSEETQINDGELPLAPSSGSGQGTLLIPNKPQNNFPSAQKKLDSTKPTSIGRK